MKLLKKLFKRPKKMTEAQWRKLEFERQMQEALAKKKWESYEVSVAAYNRAHGLPEDELVHRGA
ncbi:hypothetical protein [Streptococcus sciuri]|uniref:Phage protein n=1 Tax=Streptococcus sciuri TaxID=2973939 RepID=A0ABT2F7L3_9STRE|nr:hypothetical protein [Streptococcus sciuri]MCS4488399.1 hypothetical protein [Streptococcus sciuri]